LAVPVFRERAAGQLAGTYSHVEEINKLEEVDQLDAGWQIRESRSIRIVKQRIAKSGPWQSVTKSRTTKPVHDSRHAENRLNVPG